MTRISNCARCERPIAHTNDPTRVPAGAGRHNGHGLCCSCSQAARGTPGGMGRQRGSYTASVDEVAVLRLLAGERLPTTPNERREATALLTARGHSAGFIARHLGTTVRTVQRYRQRAAA